MLCSVSARKKFGASGSQRATRFGLRRFAQHLSAALLATLISIPIYAGTLPASAIPAGVGVNVHFNRGHEKDLDLIAAAGIRVVRTDFKWDAIERYQGIYDWAAYDELINNLAKRGLRPFFILDYSNAIYEESTPKLWQGVWPYQETMSPRRPKSIEAFARWAAAAAQRYRKHQVLWEIWNEPNIEFWRPAPNVEDYARLAHATCQAIRAVDADATIIAPATSKFPWDFLETFFKSPALGCLDAISVHPYRAAKIPETVASDYVRLRQLIDQYTPKNQKEPIAIVSGEWGYSTVRYGHPPQDQANFVVRMQLINLLHGVPLSVWYDWKNDGMDPGNYEHNFGIVTNALEFKPAYIALKTLTTELAGYRLVQRLDLNHSDDYALLFVNQAGHRKIAVWTSRRAHDSRIAAPPGLPAQLKLIDGQGLSSPISLNGHWIPLRLTHSPAYISD